MEVESKGTKDNGMVQEEDQFSVCVCKAYVMGPDRETALVSLQHLCNAVSNKWEVDNLKGFEADMDYTSPTP